MPPNQMPNAFPTPHRMTVAPGSRDPVVLPGGTLAGLVQSQEFQPFEWLWTAEPNEAWYDPARNPSNPTQFEIGSKKAPKGSTIFLMDFSFEPYMFSAVGAHEWEPAPRNAMRGSLAYQMKVAGKTPGSVEFYIEPKSSTNEPEEFMVDKVQLWGNSRPKEADFARARSASVGMATGVGTATLPQRTGRFGPLMAPFGVVVTDDQTITMRGVVTRAISIPLACVEAKVVGYIISSSAASRYIQDLASVLR